MKSRSGKGRGYKTNERKLFSVVNCVWLDAWKTVIPRSTPQNWQVLVYDMTSTNGRYMKKRHVSIDKVKFFVGQLHWILARIHYEMMKHTITKGLMASHPERLPSEWGQDFVDCRCSNMFFFLLRSWMVASLSEQSICFFVKSLSPFF